MDFFALDDIASIAGISYLIIVALFAIVSLVAFAVFFKHAEKRSLATTVAIVYIVLFIAITLSGARILNNL